MDNALYVELDSAVNESADVVETGMAEIELVVAIDTLV